MEQRQVAKDRGHISSTRQRVVRWTEWIYLEIRTLVTHSLARRADIRAESAAVQVNNTQG